MATKPRRGLLLGKFLPPHRGHCHLIDFAAGWCERLTVLVCTRDEDPIPGALRFAWVRAMYPDLDVVHVTEVLPQEPKDHPDFWAIWRRVCLAAAPEPVDVVFASEDYGARLAAELGATYAPVDPQRSLVPISGTAIRRDPIKNWDYLPEITRPYFVKRVCLFGPESTGKSTLAAQLAAHFRTVHVAEYARTWLDPKGGVCVYEDIDAIGRGQRADEDAMAKLASRVLFCDTDALTTTIWSDLLFGDCPAWLRQEARDRRYDLTLLCDIDVPWVDDSQRNLEHSRLAFFERCQEALATHGRDAVRVRGGWDQRLQIAVDAVDALLGENRRDIP